MTKFINNRKFLLRYRKVKKLYYIDVDKAYWPQCWDLVKHYSIHCRDWTPPKVGVARNATAKHFPPSKFTELRIWYDDFQQGDIVVVDLIPKNSAGHIFIVYRQYKYGLRYIDQNGKWGAWRNNKAHKIHWNGVEMRKMKRWDFKILRAFRPK